MENVKDMVSDEFANDEMYALFDRVYDQGLTLLGRTMSAREWRTFAGISRELFNERLITRDWTLEKTLSEPDESGMTETNQEFISWYSAQKDKESDIA